MPLCFSPSVTMPRILSLELSSPPASPDSCRFTRHHSLPSPSSSLFHSPLDRLLSLPPNRFSNGASSASSSTAEDIALHCNKARKVRPRLCRAASDSFDRRCPPRWQPQQRSLDALDEARFFPSWNGKPAGAAELSTCGGGGSALAVLHEEQSLVYKDLEESLSSCLDTCCTLIPSLPPPQSNPHSRPPPDGFFSKDFTTKDFPVAAMDAVKGQPLSLKMLKRKKRSCRTSNTAIRQHHGPQQLFMEVGNAFDSAFSWLVYMLKTLQSHTLSLQLVFACEDLRGMLSMVHAEMQDSFLWMFQQVLACTPKLMLLTMLLLADFTVHSMGKHVALAVTPMGEPPTVSLLDLADTEVFSVTVGRMSGGSFQVQLKDANLLSTREAGFDSPSPAEGGSNGSSRSLRIGNAADDNSGHFPSKNQNNVAGRFDREARLYGSEASTAVPNRSFAMDSRVVSVKEEELMKLIWQRLMEKDSASQPAASIVNLGPNIKQMLVAPVVAELESDDYGCYDRTELKYQQEIGLDPRNPLLLVNYAQFLYLVRRDHTRAEELFRRAVKVDPVDGEVLGRYASFLWVARGDIAAADKAYQAAVAADPSNSYHAGCYAHFLWNSQTDEETGMSCVIDAALAAAPIL